MTRVLGPYYEILRVELKGGLGEVEAAVGAGAGLRVQGPVGVEAADDQEVSDAPQLFPHPTMRWRMHCSEITLRRYARSARLNNNIRKLKLCESVRV